MNYCDYCDLALRDRVLRRFTRCAFLRLGRPPIHQVPLFLPVAVAFLTVAVAFLPVAVAFLPVTVAVTVGPRDRKHALFKVFKSLEK